MIDNQAKLDAYLDTPEYRAVHDLMNRYYAALQEVNNANDLLRRAQSAKDAAEIRWQRVRAEKMERIG